MAMIQAYQGYFESDGRFVADSPSVKLPTMRRAVVNIFYNEPIESTTPLRQQRAARLRKVIQDAHAVENDGMTDADWDELTTIRDKTNAGMSRTVNL